MAIEDALAGTGYEMPAGPAGADVPPTQVEENKSKWKQFLSRFDDPNVRQAVLATGIGLLRSPQYGQNSGDIVANALSSGAGTLQSLRNMDEARSDKRQTRTDTQTQRKTENTQRQQQIDQGQQQINISQTGQTLEAGRGNAQISETGRHNQAMEDIGRRQADADELRARSYSSVGARVPAEVQKINALQAQYMQQGMDEINARARAVMVVDSTKGATSPGEAAMNLYQNKIKFFQNDINNFGKSPTPEMMKQWQVEAMNEVMQFSQFNQATSGTPQVPAGIDPTNPRQGVIQRPPGAGPTGANGSPVGTVKSGYKKSKPGPDTDKTTWTKVNGNVQ